MVSPDSETGNAKIIQQNNDRIIGFIISENKCFTVAEKYYEFASDYIKLEALFRINDSTLHRLSNIKKLIRTSSKHHCELPVRSLLEESNISSK